MDFAATLLALEGLALLCFLHPKFPLFQCCSTGTDTPLSLLASLVLLHFIRCSILPLTAPCPWDVCLSITNCTCQSGLPLVSLAWCLSVWLGTSWSGLPLVSLGWCSSLWLGAPCSALALLSLAWCSSISFYPPSTPLSAFLQCNRYFSVTTIHPQSKFPLLDSILHSLLCLSDLPHSNYQTPIPIGALRCLDWHSCISFHAPYPAFNSFLLVQVLLCRNRCFSILASAPQPRLALFYFIPQSSIFLCVLLFSIQSLSILALLFSFASCSPCSS